MNIMGKLLFAALLICNILFLLITFKRHGSAETNAEKSPLSVRLGILFQTLSYPVAWAFRRPRINPLGGEAPFPDILIALTSVLIAVASIALAAAAKKSLGKQWALAARVVDGHRLVSDGPFGRVRNPLYLAMGMLLVAVVLGLSSITGTASAAIFYVLGTIMRIRAEERLLAETFGREFEDYRRRVPSLFPLIGRGRVPAEPRERE
jgi:protein-S-isoprenylcysteine O-methyltransferase Ste14